MPTTPKIINPYPDEEYTPCFYFKYPNYDANIPGDTAECKIFAQNTNEALGLFCTEHPHVPVDEIIDYTEI